MYRNGTTDVFPTHFSHPPLPLPPSVQAARGPPSASSRCSHFAAGGHALAPPPATAAGPAPLGRRRAPAPVAAAQKPVTPTPPKAPAPATPSLSVDVLIVGGGAGGSSLAGSIRHRSSKFSIAVVEPSDMHSYQVGGRGGKE